MYNTWRPFCVGNVYFGLTHSITMKHARAWRRTKPWPAIVSCREPPRQQTSRIGGLATKFNFTDFYGPLSAIRPWLWSDHAGRRARSLLFRFLYQRRASTHEDVLLVARMTVYAKNKSPTHEPMNLGFRRVVVVFCSTRCSV